MDVRSEAFQELFYNAPDPMYLIEFSGKFIDVNKSAVERLGYSRVEFQSMQTTDIDGSMTLELQSELLDELLCSRVIRFEGLHTTKDGVALPMEIVSRLIVLDGQEMVFSIARDTIVRKRTRELLEQKNRILETAELLSHVGSWLWDLDNDTFEVSEEWRRIHGIKDAVLSRDKVITIAHPDDCERISKALKDASVSFEPYDITHRIYRVDDSEIRYVRVRGQRFQSDSENHFYGTAQDVTDEIVMIDQLYASEKLFRDLFDNLPEGLLMTLAFDKPFSMVNETACRMLGYTKDELLNLCPKDIHPKTITEQTARHFQDQRNQKKTIMDHPVQRKDGVVIPIDIDTVTLMIDGCPNQVGVFRDVSERREAEDLRRRLFSAIEQVPESVTITDSKGFIIYVNPAFERVSGYQKLEVNGKHLGFQSAEEHPDLLMDSIWKHINKGHVWIGRLISRHKNGQLITEDATISPVLNSAGEYLGCISIRRDITEELFKEKLQRQSQKLEALGRLAGGIAHDFNNILQSVIGFAELVHRQINTDQITDQSQEYTAEIIKAGRRASELIKQILLFSRQKEQEMQPVMIPILLKEAVRLLRSALPSNVQIIEQIDRGVHRVVADPIQIHQLLMNLGTNSWESMDEKGGKIVFRVSSITLKGMADPLWPGMSSGIYTNIEIEDTGNGIDSTSLDRIFEPYFTTKANSGGSGLGLAVVHGIVKAHGGEIKVKRTDARGTLISMLFPAFIEEDEETHKSRKLSLTDSLFHGNEHVMIVDDDVSILNYLRILLKRNGYVVTEMNSSSKALSLFLDSPDTFDVVIADVTMPQMSGLEMLRQMHKVRPELPTILCTGYSHSVEKKDAVNSGIDRFMYKPVNPVKMLKALRVLLDTKGKEK